MSSAFDKKQKNSKQSYGEVLYFTIYLNFTLQIFSGKANVKQHLKTNYEYSHIFSLYRKKNEQNKNTLSKVTMPSIL